MKAKNVCYDIGSWVRHPKNQDVLLWDVALSNTEVEALGGPNCR